MDLDNSETDQKIFVCGSLGCLCLVSAWWCPHRPPPTPLFIYLSEKLSPIFSSWKNPFLFPVHLFPREDLFCIIFYLWSHLSQIDKGTNLIVFQIRKISRERSPKKSPVEKSPQPPFFTSSEISQTGQAVFSPQWEVIWQLKLNLTRISAVVEKLLKLFKSCGHEFSTSGLVT